jgi:hypothetical protein
LPAATVSSEKEKQNLFPLMKSSSNRIIWPLFHVSQKNREDTVKERPSKVATRRQTC